LSLFLSCHKIGVFGFFVFAHKRNKKKQEKGKEKDTNPQLLAYCKLHKIEPLPLLPQDWCLWFLVHFLPES